MTLTSVLPSPPFQIFSIGHSNRSFQEFIDLLTGFGIRAIADIRRFPGSRKFPRFNKDALGADLKDHGIQYVWFEALGGFRHSAKNTESPNRGLENPGFRNYADYMLTAQFRSALLPLLSLAGRLPTAVMCAESLYWKCHRRLLSDYLTAHGVTVIHILGHGSTRPHTLTSGAAVCEDGTVTYPLSGTPP